MAIDEAVYIERARVLRLQQTPAEKLLWLTLREPPFKEYRFRRQHRIGPYIVDFVSTRGKVIIEADGSQHTGDRKESQRDAYLSNLGYVVLRFPNPVILSQIDDVLLEINQTLTRSR